MTRVNVTRYVHLLIKPETIRDESVPGVLTVRILLGVPTVPKMPTVPRVLRVPSVPNVIRVLLMPSSELWVGFSLTKTVWRVQGS